MKDERPQRKQSKYAKKRNSGVQMYGPGCCAHKLTTENMRAIRQRQGTLGHSGLREV